MKSALLPSKEECTFMYGYIILITVNIFPIYNCFYLSVYFFCVLICVQRKKKYTFKHSTVIDTTLQDNSLLYHGSLVVRTNLINVGLF